MNLKFYDKEYNAFKYAYMQKINQYHIEVIFRKLQHHYYLHNTKIVYKNGKASRGLTNYYPIDINYNNCNAKPIKIIINKNCNLAILLHEIAHAREIRIYGRTKHTKRMFKLLQSIHNYIKNNVSIREMLDRYNREQTHNEDNGIFECDINKIENILPKVNK